MIIRKPYAFLIKNFKKIHIFLFLLCIYIYYKTMQTNSFVNEFMNLGTYDSFNEPISKYIPWLAYLLLLLIIASSVVIVILLRHKQKPWKLYLLPIVEYSALLFVFLATSSFFHNYDGSLETTGIRAIHDILFILSLPQYPIFIILLIRIFGVDLNKFNFKMDEEYLELESADREEIEINIDIDKESIKRGYRRLLRNMNYVYQEHKRLVQVIVVIILVIAMKNTYTYFFITNKAYNQGDIINTSGYSIRINNSYYTDKDYKGDIISKNDNFVVLDLTIKNNSVRRDVNFNRFHLMNGISNETTTLKTYETDFQDLGTTYESKNIEAGETIDLIMIFKVSKKLDQNKFVLYYQEFNDNNSAYLRKIKLKLEDVSKIKTHKTKVLTEEQTIDKNKKKLSFSLDSIELLDSVNYSQQVCTEKGCSIVKRDQSAKTGYKILKIDFASNDFEGKDMIDFSLKYGKINYIDSKGKKVTLAIENAIEKTYYGKYLYLTVPPEIATGKQIEIVFTVRNNRYTYRLN